MLGVAILAPLIAGSLPTQCLLGPADCELLRINEAAAKARCARYEQSGRDIESVCRQGHVEECLELGELTTYCDAPERAEQFYLLACALGAPSGCMRVGDRASSEAARNAWYQRAGEMYEAWCMAGDPAGCSAIANWLYDGMYGMTRDMPRAAELLAKACLGGLASACFRSSRMFESAYGDIEHDAKRATELLKVGCEVNPGANDCRRQ